MVANVRGRVTLADQAKGQVILQTEAQFPTVLRIGHESKIYINENKIIPKPEADRPTPMRRCLVARPGRSSPVRRLSLNHEH